MGSSRKNQEPYGPSEKKAVCTALFKLQQDKLELKIVLYWARGLAAEGCKGKWPFHKCRCAAVCALLSQGIRNPNRRAALKKAPQWVRDNWPSHFGDNPK